jgi:hypothetical protein
MRADTRSAAARPAAGRASAVAIEAHILFRTAPPRASSVPATDRCRRNGTEDDDISHVREPLDHGRAGVRRDSQRRGRLGVDVEPFARSATESVASRTIHCGVEAVPFRPERSSTTL